MVGCVEEPDTTEDLEAEVNQAQIERGEDIWFENSYGGEKFFTFLANHPDPASRIEIGFEAVLTTPRAVRHDIWGVINDPDCEADPNGGFDICADPEDTGVVGMRRSTARGFPEYGAACAACHAGFDPKNPPANPNEPEWVNIHPSIGNQDLEVGKIFAANLDLTNPNDAVRALVFASWPAGTVDTTALFSDNINNPGVMTAFWEWGNRNRFHVTRQGEPLDAPQLRNGQGGEDDVGDFAALRVYTNIGVCFFECVAGPAAAGVPISIDACRANCPDFPPQQDLDDLVAFLGSIERPRYPGGITDIDTYNHGSDVFDANCASCHDNSTDPLKRVLSNDEMNTLAELGINATNACRALTTNWDEGHLWEEFASETINHRTTAEKGYRNMPLSGIWSTSPFMHNQSIGVRAAADASPAERVAAFEASMDELLSFDRAPIVHTIPFAIGPFPAGTPLALVVNRDPATGELLCGDYVENRGHYFGATLSDADKDALTYFLRFQ